MSDNMFAVVTFIYFCTFLTNCFEGKPWLGGMFLGWSFANVCMIVHMSKQS